MKLDIAKAPRMIVMGVSQDETVDLTGAGYKQLAPQIGRSVYEDILSSGYEH